MTQAMISAPPKRTLTPAQRRLRKADPTMATLMDEWALQIDQTLDRFQGTLDREYDLAFAENPPPTILQKEHELALELGRFDVAIRPMLNIADGVKSARDEAFMVLGDVEQRIAERTVQFMHALTPQAALPPPPPDDPWAGDAGDIPDDDDPADTEPLRVIREQATAETQKVWVPSWRADDGEPVETRTAGGWWARFRGWGRQLRAAATLLLAGVL